MAHRRFRKTLAVPFIPLLLLLTFIIACGAAATVTPRPAATTAPATTAPAATAVRQPTLGIVATPTPRAGLPTATAVPTPTPGAAVSAKDTVRIVTNEEPTSIGAYSAGECSGNLNTIVCGEIASDPLTWLDGKSFEVVPLQQLESWEQVEPDRWRFKLREGVVFHNGAAWNAEQMKFGIDWAGDEETAGHHSGDEFGQHGVFHGEIVDDMTVDIVCKIACPILPKTTMFTKFMDMEWVKAASPDDLETMTIGLGPYKIVEWRRGIQVELEANEDYKPNTSFASQAPSIRTVLQIWANEPLVRAAMLQNGEADWAQIDMEDRDLAPRYEVASNNEAYIYVIDTLYHPELVKVEVREALNLAIDCETLMEEIFNNLLACYGNIAQPGTVGITPENSAPYGYDPGRARELLAEGNYDDSVLISLNIRQNRVPKDVEWGEAVVSYWREVGINAELNVVEAGIASTIRNSNCGSWDKSEIMAAAGDSVREKCIAKGPGPPRYLSVNLAETATSTESLDFSRQGGFRNTCFSRSSAVCETELTEMIDIANATDTGPLRTQRQTEVANHVRAHFHFVPNFLVVSVYGMAADLVWDPYYAPRIRANTMRFE